MFPRLHPADPSPATDAPGHDTAQDRVLIEVCVPDVAGALAAEAAGADRVELCADLGQGGTTPSLGAIALAQDRLYSAGLQVMIRPRGGDFVMDQLSLQVALADIAAVKDLIRPNRVPVGFVFGALTPDHRLDTDVLSELVAAAAPHPVTLHKAFDLVADQFAALDQAVALGVDRILTSGGTSSALSGASRLSQLVRQAGQDLVILAGGGVRADNVCRLVTESGVREVHLRAPGVSHGTEVTDPGVVAQLDLMLQSAGLR